MMRGSVSDRREEILSAALSCFLDKGVDRTTLEDIRRRSGASTGSIYHFFSGKDAIFGELVLETYAHLNEAMLDAIRDAKSAEASVRAVVKQYVAWVVEEPERARFLLRAPIDRMSEAQLATLSEQNRLFLRALRDRVVERAEGGEIRRMPLDVLVAIVLGPMKEYASQYIDGIAKSSPSRAARELGLAAWNAVRADPS